MNLDYKFSNSLSSKYAWAGQSKLNDYRGYAWMAVKNLDPGLVTNITETMNTTYSPKLFKWLKPNMSYSASYRWTDDLSRALRVCDKLNAGTVSINTVDALNTITPFGGVKQSGYGRDLSLHSFDKYTSLKTRWIKYKA